MLDLIKLQNPELSSVQAQEKAALEWKRVKKESGQYKALITLLEADIARKKAKSVSAAWSGFLKPRQPKGNYSYFLK